MNLTSLRRLTFLGLALTLGACETDLDPNDSYKETTFIYAVLDARQPTQRISINKAFLNTRTNAIAIAADRPDSVTFPAGVIDARLEFLRADSSVVVQVPLERVPNDEKGEGPFARTGQFIYQTPATSPRLNALPGVVAYRVVARNTRTGNVAMGVTDLPRTEGDNGTDDNYLYFKAAGNSLSPALQGGVRPFEPSAMTLRASLRTQTRAGVYSMAMDLHFFEVLNGVRTPKTLTWTIFTNLRPQPSEGEVGVTIPKDAFFTQFLNRQINPANDPPGLTREFADTAIVWRGWAGSPQWAQYQEIYGSASALTQTTPEYTNVRGGRGLVTGRAEKRVYGRFNASTVQNGQFFRDLRFVR